MERKQIPQIVVIAGTLRKPMAPLEITHSKEVHRSGFHRFRCSFASTVPKLCQNPVQPGPVLCQNPDRFRSPAG